MTWYCYLVREVEHFNYCQKRCRTYCTWEFEEGFALDGIHALNFKAGSLKRKVSGCRFGRVVFFRQCHGYGWPVPWPWLKSQSQCSVSSEIKDPERIFSAIFQNGKPHPIYASRPERKDYLEHSRTIDGRPLGHHQWCWRGHGTWGHWFWCKVLGWEGCEPCTQQGKPQKDLSSHIAWQWRR